MKWRTLSVASWQCFSQRYDMNDPEKAVYQGLKKRVYKSQEVYEVLVTRYTKLKDIIEKDSIYMAWLKNKRPSSEMTRKRCYDCGIPANVPERTEGEMEEQAGLVYYDYTTRNYVPKETRAL